MISVISLVNAGVVDDPELKYTQAGKAVCSFGIAESDRKYSKEADEWVDVASVYLRVTLWGEWAEAAALQLSKGSQVNLTGKLVTNRWDDKETGQARSRTEFTAYTYAIRPNARSVAESGRSGQPPRGGTGSGSRSAAPAGGGLGSAATSDDPPF